MKLLLTADLHLTDHVRDEYRWNLFPWLCTTAVKYKVDVIGILGDLTDAKDKHTEALVNRVVESLEMLGDTCDTIFDPGNHDGIQEGLPFFRFANHIQNVTCLVEPLDLGESLWLPNTRDYKKAWAGLYFGEFDYIFCHQTFDGCVTENGTHLQGIPPSVFKKTHAKVYSGDIHVPQKIGRNIEYVGAPYRIRFGDEFTPRVLLLDTVTGKQTDLHFPTITKHLIELNNPKAPLLSFERALNKRQVVRGDQVKLRVRLPRECFVDWPAIKAQLQEAAEKAGLVLWGAELRGLANLGPEAAPEGQSSHTAALTPVKALERYAQKERLPTAMIEAGKGFLSGGK